MSHLKVPPPFISDVLHDAGVHRRPTPGLHDHQQQLPQQQHQHQPHPAQYVRTTTTDNNTISWFTVIRLSDGPVSCCLRLVSEVAKPKCCYSYKYCLSLETGFFLIVLCLCYFSNTTQQFLKRDMVEMC